MYYGLVMVRLHRILMILCAFMLTCAFCVLFVVFFACVISLCVFVYEGVTCSSSSVLFLRVFRLSMRRIRLRVIILCVVRLLLSFAVCS